MQLWKQIFISEIPSTQCWNLYSCTAKSVAVSSVLWANGSHEIKLEAMAGVLHGTDHATHSNEVCCAIVEFNQGLRFLWPGDQIYHPRPLQTEGVDCRMVWWRRFFEKSWVPISILDLENDNAKPWVQERESAEPLCRSGNMILCQVSMHPNGSELKFKQKNKGNAHKLWMGL